MMSVEVAPGAVFTISPPRRLFPTGPYTVMPGVPSFDVSPDGKQFLMLRETTPTDRNELIVVQNWVEEMKARAGR
jgi:hypothetical protein